MDNFQVAPLIDKRNRSSARCLRIMAVVMVLAICHFTLEPLATAQTKEEGGTESTESQGGLGIGAALLTIPYGVAKVVFALCGGIVGGLTYVFTGADEKAAKKVWDTSIRGTYVITPDHLKGNKPVRFLGVPPEEEAGPDSAVPEPAPTP
ncbi:MAG: hypothetical protein AB1555_11115 [Nitrospirota bacterium]